MDPRCKPLPAELDDSLSLLTEPGCLPQLAYGAGAMPDGQQGHVEPPCEATCGKVFTSSLSHDNQSSDDRESEHDTCCVYKKGCTYSTVHSLNQPGASCLCQSSGASRPCLTRSSRKVRFSDVIHFWFPGPNQTALKAHTDPCSATFGVQGCGFTNLAPSAIALHSQGSDCSQVSRQPHPLMYQGVQGSGLANRAPSSAQTLVPLAYSEAPPHMCAGVQGGGLANLAPPFAHPLCTQTTGQVHTTLPPGLAEDFVPGCEVPKPSDEVQTSSSVGPCCSRVQGCGFSNLAPFAIAPHSQGSDCSQVSRQTSSFVYTNLAPASARALLCPAFSQALPHTCQGVQGSQICKPCSSLCAATLHSGYRSGACHTVTRPC